MYVQRLEKDYKGEPTNGDIWDRQFLLSDVLQAISDRINAKEDIPKIYILSGFHI